MVVDPVLIAAELKHHRAFDGESVDCCILEMGHEAGASVHVETYATRPRDTSLELIRSKQISGS